MLGAIAGDIIGSVYEFQPWQGAKDDFPLFTPRSTFTDDTVLTVALAQALMDCQGRDDDLPESIVDNFHAYGKKYPGAGYGGRFAMWLGQRERTPYNSFGNGSAMRVSPAGWIADSLEETERYARISAAVTHNHPEGIKGACSVAGCIYLARQGSDKNAIRDYASGKYGYDLSRSLAEIKKVCTFNETCQVSVPEAITAFLESGDYESAVRNAVWLGADADTQAAIAGGIAEAFYGGVPDAIAREALARLDDNLLAKYRQWESWLQSRS